MGVSLSGSMKRSRSICPDQNLVTEMQRQLLRDEDSTNQKCSRQSSVCEETSLPIRGQYPGHIVDQSEDHTTSVRVMKAASASTPRRTRFESEAVYLDTEVEDLVDMLKSTNDMETHGDILHYMVTTYGMSFKTSIGVIKDLLRYGVIHKLTSLTLPSLPQF